MAPHHFIRLRKSAIVSSARISEIRPMFDGVYDIPTGRRNGDGVLEPLENPFGPKVLPMS